MSEKKFRTLMGKVTSDKMDKTITVLVERYVKHPKYGKFVRKSTKLMARDVSNTANIGDTVTIRETKPFSKNVSWELVEVVSKVVD